MGHGLTARVAIVTQADGVVGSGHAVEACAIAAEARRQGVAAEVAIPRAGEPVTRGRWTGALTALDDLATPTLRALGQRWAAEGVDVVLTNLRHVTAEHVSALAEGGAPVVCIDEAPGRRLPCAAVIRPRWDAAAYESNVPGFRVHTGPAYLAMAEPYAALHQRERAWRGPIRSVVVSMGGVDPSGATLRVVEALTWWASPAQRHVVLGPGFPHEAALTARLGAQPDAPWTLHRNPPSLAALLAEADVAISAGGNTLVELACVGTPAIVAHEEPHEAEQGRAFAERGFGVTIGRGADVAPEAVLAALDRFEAAAVRQAHGGAGRRLIDGLGSRRIVELVRALNGGHRMHAQQAGSPGGRA